MLRTWKEHYSVERLYPVPGWNIFRRRTGNVLRAVPRWNVFWKRGYICNSMQYLHRNLRKWYEALRLCDLPRVLRSQHVFRGGVRHDSMRNVPRWIHRLWCRHNVQTELQRWDLLVWPDLR